MLLTGRKMILELVYVFFSGYQTVSRLPQSCEKITVHTIYLYKYNCNFVMTEKQFRAPWSRKLNSKLDSTGKVFVQLANINNVECWAKCYDLGREKLLKSEQSYKKYKIVENMR